MTTTSKTCTWQPPTTPRIAASLRPYVDSLRDAGFDVHLPRPEQRRVVEYAYVTKADLPGCVLIEDAPFARLGQRPQVSVPVRPSREYGSAVLVDFDGGPQQLPAVLAKVMASPKVVTRFIEDPQMVPVDMRIPADAVRLAGRRSLNPA